MEPAGGRQNDATRGPAGLCLLGLVYSSLLLNAILLAHRFLSPPRLLGDGGGGSGCGLTWSLQAAREAEAVAAVECSGHGQVFLDGIAGEDGRPGCECNSCFGGPDCSLRTPNCTADADSGNPLFLEPYWRHHAAASAVVFSGWHRMSYSTTGRFQSVELERQIRRLHGAVGNAVADDKHLVFASGSMQLINALVHALSPDSVAASPPSRVVAAAPYYSAYKSQTSMFDGREYRWAGTTALWANASRANSTDGFIEFVTSPNNPDAVLREPALGGSAAAIVDRAYYWPHFTHIPAPADEDVMMFTISKPSGHAGSRFGWALVRDEKVANKALDYVSNSNMGASRDTQLRMLGIVKFMLANLRGKEDIFGFGHDVIRSRWRRLSAVVARSRRISLQNVMDAQYCTYFNRVREPSPAYAWVRCEREEDEDCYEALLKAKIITRAGVEFEGDSWYTRISLLKSDDDFDVLMERLQDLVDAEKYDAPNGSCSTSM